MAANTVLTVTDLDFNSIKNNLKTFLQNQSRFQDYDFEGSGMSVLLDILAYNTHYNAYYLNMIANEMFLDTSQIRQSTVSHAKLINYVPESSHGAETMVNITVTPENGEEDPENPVTELTLNKYTRFIGSSIDGINYPFVTLSSNTVSRSESNNNFYFSNVVIKQGEVITRQFLMTGANSKRRFDLPSANIDTNTLVVRVQESQSNTQTVVYNLVDDITGVTSTSTVYFLEENSDGNYSIYFGDNVIGKSPANDNIIICTYLDTLGSLGNKIRDFTAIDGIGDIVVNFNNNVSVVAVGATYSGTEKETIEQVKFRAPYYYTAQNRAVTIGDYETLITKDYPNIDSVSVWGGEENDPPVYGKIFLSLKTKENFFLSVLEKENIKDTLIRTRNVLTVTPEIIDPEYKYILTRGKIYFNPSVTSLSAGEIRTYAKSAIEDYSNDNLNQFRSVFLKSRMQAYIEESDSSITSSDLTILLQKRIALDLNTTKNYTIDFDVPIKKSDFKTAFSTYPSVTVLDDKLEQRNVFFEEVPSIASGIDRIEITNGGVNYTTVPTVTITGDGTGATAEAKIAGGKIYEITVTNKGINYSRAFVTLSGGNGNGAIVTPILESRTSLIRSFYLSDNQENPNENGKKVFVNLNAGKIDYDSGKITFTSLTPLSVVQNDFYDPNILTVNVPIDTEIVKSLREKIVVVDVNDPLAVQLEVIAQ